MFISLRFQPHFNSKESGVDFSFLDDSTTDLDSGEEEIGAYNLIFINLLYFDILVSIVNGLVRVCLKHFFA